MTKAEIRKHFEEKPLVHQVYEIRAESASIDENGVLKGDANVIGELDTYNTVTFPGFFEKALPSFLKNGFVPVGHNWDDLPIAYPTVARETGKTLYTESVFHSTARAQEARTVAKERLDAGKSVGLSVGFYPDYESGVEYFANGKELVARAKELGMDMSLFNVKQINAHTKPCRANLPGGCKELAEYSIVNRPANKPSGVTDVRSEDPNLSPSETPEKRFYYWGDEDDDPWEDIEESMTIGAVDRLNWAMRTCLYICLSMEATVDSRTAVLRGHLKTYSDKVEKVFSTLLSMDEDDDKRSTFIGELRASLFQDSSDTLGAKIAQAAKDCKDVREFEDYLKATFKMSKKQATVLASSYFKQPDTTTEPNLQSDSGGEGTDKPDPETLADQGDPDAESRKDRTRKFLELKERHLLLNSPNTGG